MLKNRTENEPERDNVTASQTHLDAQSLPSVKQSVVDKIESCDGDTLPKEVLKAGSLPLFSIVEKDRNAAAAAKSEQNIEFDASNTKSPDWNLTDFLIEHGLGQGQYGKVYLVHEKSTKYAYAMKKQSRNPTIDIMVCREIGIQLNLCHRNIIRMYGYFFRDTEAFFILEYAPNGNLLKRLYKQPNKRFEEKCAARYILSCADALAYLHQRDIIHRDIKPENVLFGFNDELKIADFGLSVNAENQRRRTICGTPDYIPPEIMNGESYSKEVDLWSLGVLCYDLLIGEWAFKSSTKKDIYCKTVQALYNPFPDFLSKGAGHLIRRLIVVAPEHRLPLIDVKKHPWIISNTQ